MLIQAIESYLAVRRAAGFDLKSPEFLLRSFARFASNRSEMHVRAQTAIEWASLAPSPQERNIRLKTVIRLARHVRAEDDRHEIPPDGVFGHHSQRRVPFIFSPMEICQLIKHALRLGPVGSLKPHTYGTLFALLAAAGLRISEALALRLNDITPDGLVIRKTKFRKSRLLPLHKTAVDGIQRYLSRRQCVPSADDHLFISLQGRRLLYHTVRRVFLMLVKTAGIERGPNRPAPNIHSFRHTFAVRALENCPDDRDRVGQHILALTTYMGHADVSCTYWYLEATPQLLVDIAQAWQTFVRGGGR